jgi:cytochrome c5
MLNRRHSLLSAALFIVMPISTLLIAGCAPKQEVAPAPSGPQAGGPMGGPGGGRRGGGGGGGGGPVAENASGSEIYQAKCNCHGADGKGKRAPALTGASSKSDDKLTSIIHDGKGKMPAFGSQLSDAQIKKVVAYIKEFK